MKFSLVAVLVVLALAQGSLAQDALEVEKITNFFNEWKDKLSQELTETINAQQVADNAQTFLNDKKAQLDKVVADLTEQLKTTFTGLEEKFKPQAASIQAQLQTMAENVKTQVEALIQKTSDQTQAIGN